MVLVVMGLVVWATSCLCTGTSNNGTGSNGLHLIYVLGLMGCILFMYWESGTGINGLHLIYVLVLMGCILSMY